MGEEHDHEVVAHEFVNGIPTKYRCVYCQGILTAGFVADNKIKVLKKDHILDGDPWRPWKPSRLGQPRRRTWRC